MLSCFFWGQSCVLCGQLLDPGSHRLIFSLWFWNFLKGASIESYNVEFLHPVWVSPLLFLSLSCAPSHGCPAVCFIPSQLATNSWLLRTKQMQTFTHISPLPWQPSITYIIQGRALGSELACRPCGSLCWSRLGTHVGEISQVWKVCFPCEPFRWSSPFLLMEFPLSRFLLLPPLLSFLLVSFSSLSSLILFLFWVNFFFLACSFTLPNHCLVLHQHPFVFISPTTSSLLMLPLWFFSHVLAYYFLFKMYLSDWLKVHSPPLLMCLLLMWCRLFSWWDDCPSNVSLLCFASSFPPHGTLVTQATHDGGRCQTPSSITHTHSELGMQ